METTTIAERHPVRTCVGCRRRAPQSELIRLVLGGDGRPQASRTAPGRGAWICGAGCLRAAIRRRGFERAWRSPVDAGAIEAIEAELAGGAEEATPPTDERLRREARG